MTLYKKSIKFLSSLKLAVIVILLIAIASSIGTFVESRYDAFAAQKLVYKTWWMYGILGLLAVNLTAVMVDRWPWKWKHAPFISAHIGILLLLAGSILTYQFGLDGTMRFEIGQSQRTVTLPDMEVRVHSSFDGTRFTKLYQKNVDFFLKPPSLEKPYSVPLGGGNQSGDIRVVDYKKYTIPQKSIVSAEGDNVSQRQLEQLGAGARILLKNDRTSQSLWLFQRKKDQEDSQTMGLARVVLGPMPVARVGSAENVVFLNPVKDGLEYNLFYADGKRSPIQGKIKEGESFNTGWMGLELSLLRYYPKATEKWDFKDLDRPTPISTSAIRVQFQNQDQWIQQNDVVKFFTDEAVYFFSYGNIRRDLGFDINLIKFNVGRYEGTMRAASYESLVRTPTNEEVLISMNEPLKHEGYTFYQASFQEDEMGKPVASILSVNHDPGRFLKYLGSLIMSLGVVWLFYNKRRATRAKAPAQGAAV